MPYSPKSKIAGTPLFCTFRVPCSSGLPSRCHAQSNSRPLVFDVTFFPFFRICQCYTFCRTGGNARSLELFQINGKFCITINQNYSFSMVCNAASKAKATILSSSGIAVSLPS
jgi:hypothetical protein